MDDVAADRRWLLHVAIVVYVLALSVAIDQAGPAVAWGVGALGALGLAGLALWRGRGA